MPDHIIIPKNGYMSDDLIRLAREYGDTHYVEEQLQDYVNGMSNGGFKIYNDNHYWLFWRDDQNIWWCIMADQKIENPNNPRYRADE